MRWLLALSLAACSIPETNDVQRYNRELREELREAGGDANLVFDGRHYMVAPEALQPEIRAFTGALAAEIEAAHDSRSGASSVTGREPVIAEPWLERGLRVRDLCVVAFTAAGVMYYRIWVGREHGGGYITEEVPDTPAVEAAWAALATAAREHAVFTDTFGAMGELQRPGSRSIRGTGGCPPDPQEPPSAEPR